VSYAKAINQWQKISDNTFFIGWFCRLYKLKMPSFGTLGEDYVNPTFCTTIARCPQSLAVGGVGPAL
jgi:hypothetical protein